MAGFTVYSQEEPSSAAWRSLQHDIFEVFLQDGVLDGVEDEADIFCVYRCGEVVEQRLPSVSPFTTERLHQECLEGVNLSKLQSQLQSAFCSDLIS